MDFFVNLIILLITLFVFLYWRFKKAHEFFDKNGITYLKPTFLIGNIGQAFYTKKTIPVLHLELYRKLAPNKFAGYFNFHTPILMVRDPELIKYVFIKDFDHFYDRGINVNTDVEPLGNHLLAMKGEEWKNLRVKLTSTFTGGKMKMMFPLVKECGDKLTKVLETMVNGPVDVKDLLARYTTDVIGTCAFGIETHSLDNPDSEFRRMGNRIFEFRFKALLLSTIPEIPKQLIKLFNLRFIDREVEEFLMSIVENTVKYREDNKVSRNDFIDLLLSLKHQTMGKYQDHQEKEDLDHFLSQVGSNQSKKNIGKFSLLFHFQNSTSNISISDMTIDLMAAQCFIFFGAGFETSSTALGFLLLELALHQDIQDKVREEINTVINNNPEGLTYEVLKEMPYVDMVISESLRKYPATGFAQRQCTIDYKIPDTDITIPKNMLVTIPIFGIHRDPQYYERPEDFYPEHFTKEAIAKRPHYTYLPFGEGPRACIGERFAKMQVKMGLISMLRDFSFDISPKTTLPVQYQRHFILLKAKGGIWLNCKKI
uniref:Cytochrome P450 6PZ27 n=1 Tax=Maconellicoccus hirsutus TaxID=177089 RepID=A0AAT9UVC6_MACHI